MFDQHRLTISNQQEEKTKEIQKYFCRINKKLQTGENVPLSEL